MTSRIELLLLSTLLGTTTFAPAQNGLKMDNEAARVSGLQPRIEVPHHDTLAPKTGLTIEAWITYDETTLPTGLGARYPSIIRKGIGSFGNGENHTYLLRVDAVTTSARLVNFALRTWDTTQNKGVVTRATYSFAAGEFKNWTHLAATFDGSDMRIFVNGVEKAKVATAGAEMYDETKGKVAIGTGGLRDYYETWHGEIDELRLWPLARTGAEIQSTMNLRLAGVPGLCSTWNLDGAIPSTTTAPDSSGNNHGNGIALTTANSGGQYATNSLTLTSASLGATGFGAGTAGCSGTPAAGLSGLAKVGSSALSITCVNSGVGGPSFLWLGVGALSTPIPLLGANLWVDSSKPGLLFAIAANASGLVQIPLAIPASTPTNVSMHGQFAFAETSCNVPLFTSQGLTITTQ
ncbi:MAG: LamG domain-containing protein [Planctomycetes bacterium]|nr:LamG domain-containing protein [Planctomycetota bacterium]MCB9889593.1 LamG domain-containing protein [Planctomycetota bacterium]